ncbi:MAG: DUF1441 family protein [Shewanella sp.]
MEDAYNWNITRLAAAFSMHRDTVRKKLAEASVVPCGRNGNAPLYAIHEAAAACFSNQIVSGDGSDPDKLDPKSRKDWFQSENERLKYQRETKELVPSTEVRDELAIVLKRVTSFFDSLPDRMERSRQFTAEQLEALEKVSDQLRVDLYNDLKDME